MSTSDEYNKVKNAALMLLGRRDYSYKELIGKLISKSDNRDILDTVLSELKEKNYQSDERFTEMFVRSRKNQGKGPLRIEQELRQKGISSELIEDYLLSDNDVWFNEAQRVYLSKYGDQADVDAKEKSKRLRFMVGRGFSPSYVYRLFAM